MGKYKNLLVNIGLFTLNTVSTKLITFLLVPLYTYFLTAAQYGVTDMSLTVAGLVTPVVTLSIGDATTRYIIDDPDDKNDIYLSGLGDFVWLPDYAPSASAIRAVHIRRPRELQMVLSCLFCFIRFQCVLGKCGKRFEPD